MASITVKDVEEIAVLARLLLAPDEAARLCGDLASILAYVEKLQALDTTDVEPMTHAVPMDCRLREDVVGVPLDAEEVMERAPRRSGPFFEVPRIIDISTARERAAT